MRVGIRRHITDDDYENYELGSMSPATTLAKATTETPVAFGESVADFDIEEPLGNVITILRTDRRGVNWWGSLSDELPAHRTDPPNELRPETGA